MPGDGRYSIGRPGIGLDLPVSAGFVISNLAWQQVLDAFTVPDWTVEAEADGAGFVFRLIGDEGDTAIEATFARRIELAASMSSSSGRFLVYVQGNNLASEVTVLDALARESWTVELRHDAGLAAYAINIAIDPEERCVAIGQVRADGSPAQSWLVDLETQRVARPIDGFIVGWVA